PEGFLDSICKMYDYNTLQEVKESLYYYNEEKISFDIQDYLFGVNFETGAKVKSPYTKKSFEISEDFFKTIEFRLLGEKIDQNIRDIFRRDIQKIYASQTLTKEIMVEEKNITETELYDTLMEKYVYHLKEKVLDPFLENDNFRRAIKDYDTEEYKTYDSKIREDVTFLINNLKENFLYSKKGAKEVCIYVVDNDLAKKFSK
ncbi:MAG: serine protein kinase PrkA, partial [bacterium]|nr:serine protein kinase PrkA [bacterium]